MHSTQIIITFETKPELAAAFAALLEQVKRDLPAVPGCQSVRLFAATGNPCLFTLLEHWDSASQHQSHIDTVVSSGAWATLAAHLAKDPVSHYYTER